MQKKRPRPIFLIDSKISYSWRFVLFYEPSSTKDSKRRDLWTSFLRILLCSVGALISSSPSPFQEVYGAVPSKEVRINRHLGSQQTQPPYFIDEDSRNKWPSVSQEPGVNDGLRPGIMASDIPETSALRKAGGRGCDIPHLSVSIVLDSSSLSQFL